MIPPNRQFMPRGGPQNPSPHTSNPTQSIVPPGRPNEGAEYGFRRFHAAPNAGNGPTSAFPATNPTDFSRVPMSDRGGDFHQSFSQMSLHGPPHVPHQMGHPRPSGPLSMSSSSGYQQPPRSSPGFQPPSNTPMPPSGPGGPPLGFAAYAPGSSRASNAPPTQPSGPMQSNAPVMQSGGPPAQPNAPLVQPGGHLAQYNAPSMQPSGPPMQSNAPPMQVGRHPSQYNAPSMQPGGPSSQSNAFPVQPGGPSSQYNAAPAQPGRYPSGALAGPPTEMTNAMSNAPGMRPPVGSLNAPTRINNEPGPLSGTQNYMSGPPSNYSTNELASGNYQQPDTMGSLPLQSDSISDELMASQCSPDFMRASVSVLPHSQDFANRSHITIGVVIRPLAPQNQELDVINFGSTGVVRCRHCRTYINPFVQWVDNGRRWRCNLCGVSNDVASSYFSHLKSNQQRQDREERPELHKGSVEFVAPSEYMMRPPQPPCYVFVIDVSAPGVGALRAITETIKTQLDHLPGSPRTRLGFITFDSTVHFYNLKATLKTPQMMVIADLEELFIPIPDELLVNLSESRDVIDALLDGLPSIHENTRNVESALGPAIRVAFKLMSSIGGKMLVFQSSIPSAGQGALRNRENPKLIGTDKEHTLLNPVNMFYRTHAIDFCRQQVSVDTFLLASQYIDVATIGCLSRFSAGQVYYYPNFNAERDGNKLRQELTHCLRRETGWEAVMRVRCTKGMRLSNFYGNSFLRGPDLLALPTCDADASFAVEIVHSDTLLSSPTISIQAALLYTHSEGERRIRVHTICLPVTKLFAQVFRSVDADTLCNLIAKNALETCLKTGFESARTRMHSQCTEIIRAYRNSGAYGSTNTPGHQLQLPESLQLLPLYIMSLLKNPAFRGGNDLNPEERCFLQYELNNMSVRSSKTFMYPRLFALHALPPAAGFPEPYESNGESACAGKRRIVLPPLLNLSIDRLASDGIFLLDDSLTLYLWIGRAVPSIYLQSLFGVESMEGMNTRQMRLLKPHDAMSNRVYNVMEAIREENAPFMEVVILREGDPSEGCLFWKLVEDRASFQGGTFSYAEFLGQLSRSCLSTR